MTADPATPTLRDTLTSAIRYWEPRRLIYNAALLVVAASCFASGWPASKQALRTETLLGIFVLAVLANVAYCAAYIPDLAIQHSSMRDTWLRWRWALLAVGTMFASAITYLIASGLFAPATGTGSGSL